MIRSKAIAEALYQLYERSIKHIDLTTLQDALILFQQQGVITMDMEHHLLIAKVRDKQLHTVQLNTNLLGNSQCSCRKRDTCIHLVAVFYAGYAFQGFRPELIVKKATELQSHKPVKLEQANPDKAAAPRPIITPEPKKSAVTKPNSSQAPKSTPATASIAIYSEDDVAIWHSYFHAKFKQFPTSKGFVDFSTTIHSMTRNFILMCQNWPAHKQHFFKIHICLFQLQKLEEYSRNTHKRSSYYYGHGLTQTIQECYERLSQHLLNIQKTAPTKLDSQQLEQTAAYLSMIAFTAEPSPIEWNYFYRLIWDIVIQDPSLQSAEKFRLTQFLEQPDLTKSQRRNGYLALAYFWFIENNDPKATECMEKSGLKMTLELNINFINSLKTPNDSTRLLYWLNWLKPFMFDALQHELEHYLDEWAALVPKSLTEAAYLQQIAEFLPRSSSYYTKLLLEQENYATLIDYMLSNHLPLTYLPTAIIRKIEAKQAQLLLPFYHLTVEKSINQKNRDAYKYAAKAMKRLQLIYKKLKQTEQWDRYYTWVTSHYSRLSALQEEIKRGLA